MKDFTDQQLLSDYALRQSESAFAELVRRHVDLVYSAARRMVCDDHLAKDVTQGVFLALAKDSAALSKYTVLEGWLHCTARNIASKVVRTEVRRRSREQEAASMNETFAGESDAKWEEIAPHLDEALGELNESDRGAILLRYFEGKTAREIAGKFGISEEAAHKRMARSVQRLRDFFSKRGVSVGASGLVMLVSANGIQSAPLGLASAISGAVGVVALTTPSAAFPLLNFVKAAGFKGAVVLSVIVAAALVVVFQVHKKVQQEPSVNLTRSELQAPVVNSTNLKTPGNSQGADRVELPAAIVPAGIIPKKPQTAGDRQPVVAASTNTNINVFANQTIATNGNSLGGKIPPRDSNAKPQMIDLTEYYNAALTEGWMPDGYSTLFRRNDLLELPKGLQKFAGVEFDVRGLIQLPARGKEEWTKFPEQVNGIKVARVARQLNFLHGTGYPEKEGAIIGYYIINYESGPERRIPITYGQDVRDWWDKKTEPRTIGRAKLAWTGTNESAEKNGASLRLYCTAWKNPQPQTLISSIDFVSLMSESAPFLIAVTAD